MEEDGGSLGRSLSSFEALGVAKRGERAFIFVDLELEEKGSTGVPASKPLRHAAGILSLNLSEKLGLRSALN